MTRTVLLAAALLVGCKDSTASEQPLVVFAASSLTDAFAEIERDFESEHSGVDLQTSSAGSQALRVQLEHGAPADVFASANAAHIEALHDAAIVGEPVAFTTNTLVLAVPSGNPAGVESFAELPNARRIVLGGDTVPVGAYTQELLERADAELGEGFARRVQDHVVSREPNVRLVVAKVELGEADAAIVYRSDVVARLRVEALTIPDDLLPSVEYFAAPVARSTAPALARAFVEHLGSERGQATLARHGFGG
jgi:molybdate transport system substrate-binding protein